MQSSEFSGYVNQLTNGSNLVSIFDLIEIDKNYNFLLKILKKGSQILEIGPGGGYFIDWLIINGYQNIIFVDLDEENVKSLNEKYKKRGIEGYFSDGVEYLKNTNTEFDLIISRQVVEHMEPNSVSAYFEHGKRVLKKDGIMVTETINAQNLFYGNYLRFCDFSHKNSFTEKSFKEYSGKFFNINQMKFLQYHNISIFIILYYILFEHKKWKTMKKGANLGLSHIQHNTNPDNNKGKYFSRIIKSLSRTYRFRKSNIISKHYLGGDCTIFSEFIIHVAKK